MRHDEAALKALFSAEQNLRYIIDLALTKQWDAMPTFFKSIFDDLKIAEQHTLDVGKDPLPTTE